MATKIVLSVQKGSLSGKSFIYDEKDSLIVGRDGECAIVLPEATVSRYHCLLDITPSSVMVRDFGSLNGTYLNGEKIGKRGAGVSVEDARNAPGEEFALKPGDRLGLGKDCELSFEVKLATYCADCFGETDGAGHTNSEGMPICAECQEKREAKPKGKAEGGKGNKKREADQKKKKEMAELVEAMKDIKAKADAEKIRRKAEAEERIAEEEEKKRQELANKHKAELAQKEEELKQRNAPRCELCGVPVLGATDGSCICGKCQVDPEKAFLFLIGQARKRRGDARAIAGYRQVKMLGKGGMGQVWLVEEEKTGKRMALKLMLPQAAVEEVNRKTFLREAYVAGQLDHKNVVRHFKCGRSGDVYFILMELCNGGSVDSLIEKNGGRLSIDMATTITLQVLDGLAYAHGAPVAVQLPDGETVTADGIVHRDFKPGNIFLTGEGKDLTAKVADFGLAKAFETAGLSGHTRSCGVAGTPVFMPRQQILTFKYAKPDVDVWAAAASYYFMLTGAFTRDFHPRQDPFAVVLATDVIPIRKRDSRIPGKLAEVIDFALRDKPKIGVQSAMELKKLIADAL